MSTKHTPGPRQQIEQLITERDALMAALQVAANDLASLAVMLAPGTPACAFAQEASDAATAAYRAVITEVQS